MGSSVYFNCEAGISGDMAVAALIDLGASRTSLEKALSSIPAAGFRTAITRVQKNGIDCCDFNVILDEDNRDHDMEYLFGHSGAPRGTEGHSAVPDAEGSPESHREHHGGEHHHGANLTYVNSVIDGTEMTDGARRCAKKIFSILCDAEAAAHGLPPEDVHFHEVGALDSIVDIIALAVCFDSLDIERVYIPRIFEGCGSVRCRHGILPIPVPAVLNIAQKYSLPLSISRDIQGEFVTPTGAAFAAAVRTDGALPASFTVKKVGLGAGKRVYDKPSILRAMIIEDAAERNSDTVVRLEANIDDSTGEQLGYALECLFECGALDAAFIPCYMKKNRPAYLLYALCDEANRTKCEEVFFEETSTLGVRRVRMERIKLPRKVEEIATKWGAVRVKVSGEGGCKRFHPEYDDVSAICRRESLPFTEVYDAARKAAEESER